LKKDVEEQHLISYSKLWLTKNPNKRRECINKYSRTEKGLYASSRRNATRHGKFKSACLDLSWEEKKLIVRFYKNCPQGYEVDHIIPIAKGGKNCLSNLQYLTKEENRRKSAKINFS
jgi:5-methylcytosine-specific restriction endonuclease McrA